MAIQEFKGFAGVILRAEVSGSLDDPAVLLVHTDGKTCQSWAGVADALVQAGRRVVNLDLRGHGASDWAEDGRYDFASYVEDIKCVLSQMAVRPVIVAETFGGLICAVALAEGGAHLASGLVIVEEVSASEKGAIQGAIDPRVDAAPHSGRAAHLTLAAADEIQLPVLIVKSKHGNEQENEYVPTGAFKNAEVQKIEPEEAGSDSDRLDTLNATLLGFLERRVPRFLPDYRSGSDPRTLRDALGCFATGVTVVTAMDADGNPVGLTANSFTSVSLDPPLLLVCIAKTSNSLKVMQQVSHFAVNVLQIGQQPVSNLFAKSGEDRFSNTPWQAGQNGAPILTGALVNFECRRHAEHDGGDHIILIGHVERARYEPRRDPLLYFKGKYRRLHFA